MGRYVPTNIVGTSTHIIGNTAGPINQRVQLQCGAWTDFPNFIPSDMVGLSLQYHATNNAASADTFTIEPGILFGDFASETLLGGTIASVTNPVAAGTNVLFHFPFSAGLDTYHGGNGTYVTSFQLTGTLATVNYDVDCWLQNLGGAGFLNTAPQQLTATPQPGYNLVSYAYAPPALSFGSWNIPAGQTQNLYRGPSSAGPWTLVATGVTGPYKDYTVLNSWYQVSSVDPSAGESAARTTTAAAAMPLPVVGGGRSIARDMLSMGLFG